MSDFWATVALGFLLIGLSNLIWGPDAEGTFAIVVFCQVGFLISNTISISRD